MFQFLIIALVFFYLGKATQNHKNAQKDLIEESIDTIVNKARTLTAPKKKSRAGVLPFKTNEDFEDERSGAAALDTHWKKSGKFT